MPDSHLTRKGILVSKGVTVTAVAEAAGCSITTASRVIAGERIDNPAGRRVMEVVGTMTGLSITELWPEAEGSAA